MTASSYKPVIKQMRLLRNVAGVNCIKKTALLLRRVAHILLAVEATNPAENLPDGVAIGVTTGIAREEKHRATSFSEFVSRRQHELQPNCGPLRKRHLKLDNYFTSPWFRTLHGIVMMWM